MILMGTPNNKLPSRLRSLLNDLKSGAHANDLYLEQFDAAFELEHFQELVDAYDEALVSLDEPAWDQLKQKAIDHFRDENIGRGKDGLFNHLNEAFAYHYLVRHGYRNINFIPESPNKKKPDLSYSLGNELRFCEVKTLNLSREEISRLNYREPFEPHKIYGELNEKFFRSKLKPHLDKASKQIQSNGMGFVFIIINFDDFTLQFYEKYKQQIMEYLASEFPDLDVYMKIGILGSLEIHHLPQSPRTWSSEVASAQFVSPK